MKKRKSRAVRRRNPNARKRKVAARRRFQHKYEFAKKVASASNKRRRSTSSQRARYNDAISGPTKAYYSLSRLKGEFIKRGTNKHLINEFGWYLEPKNLPKRGKYQRGRKRNPRQAKPDGYEGFYPVQLLKGQFVKRKADAHKVYRVGSYDREYRRWRLDDTTDISRDIMVKTGTKLFAGFTY